MLFLYPEWKRKLLAAAGTSRADVERIGDFVLELFWRDGCEPNVSALLDYAQSGLHPTYEARKQERQAAARPGPSP